MHLADSSSNASHVKERVGYRRKDEDRPTAVFIDPGFEAVINIGPFDDSLSAETCQVTGKLAQRTARPCRQTEKEGIEHSAHGIDDRDTWCRE